MTPLRLAAWPWPTPTTTLTHFPPKGPYTILGSALAPCDEGKKGKEEFGSNNFSPAGLPLSASHVLRQGT